MNSVLVVLCFLFLVLVQHSNAGKVFARKDVDDDDAADDDAEHIADEVTGEASDGPAQMALSQTEPALVTEAGPVVQASSQTQGPVAPVTAPAVQQDEGIETVSVAGPVAPATQVPNASLRKFGAQHTNHNSAAPVPIVSASNNMKVPLHRFGAEHTSPKASEPSDGPVASPVVNTTMSLQRLRFGAGRTSILNSSAPAIEHEVTAAASMAKASKDIGSQPARPKRSTEAVPPASATINMASSLNRFGNAQHAEPAAKPTADSQAAADAENAHVAAATAKSAAKVATKVAVHSAKMTENAKSALRDAHDALHKARVDTAGLSESQRHQLKSAEAKLKEATKSAEYGQVKNAKYVKAEVDNKKLKEMEEKMTKIKAEEKRKRIEEKRKRDDELEAMRQEIKQLRSQLKEKEGDKAEDDAMLKELQDQIEEMEAAEAKDDKHTKKSHDELKAEIERLRTQIKEMEDKKADEADVTYKIPESKPEPSHPLPKVSDEEEKEEEVEKYDMQMKPLPTSGEKEAGEEKEGESEATPVQQKGIDIDTAMPYGDLEPFGREDTAQELTESSIKESDEMVDQLERAEVAEEKRAVFRALTRLRGAAITSFDGVARSQTGQIDEYNKIHKWRSTHPLHHLADEESDVSKWAFPENAD